MTNLQEHPWVVVCDHLSRNLDSDDVDARIKPLQALHTNDQLTLYAPNPFVKERVDEEFLGLIRKHLPPEVKGVAVVVGERPRPSTSGPGTDQSRLSGAIVPDSQASASKSARKVPAPAASPEGFLPMIWGDGFRAVSSDLARTAFFTVNRYGLAASRPARARALLFSQKNISLLVTGEETNTFDEKVFMQLMQFQRRQKVGEGIAFSLSEVCEELEIPMNGENARRVLASIRRLRDTKVELRIDSSTGPRGFEGQMISDLFYDESQPKTSRYVVSFSKGIVPLFSGSALTWVSWQQRRSLHLDLAQKLHSYYATHRHPFPLTVSSLYQMSGSSLKSMSKFRQRLREALDELVEIGFLTAWTSDKGKIHVVRTE